ncbi:MAG TPA: thioredoxin-dependent thiol peroxidase [Dehalococcoidia bacterium]
MAEDLKPGDTAPAFDTVDDQGNAVKLADLKGKRVVLYFYPKDNTPGCTQQACAFRDVYGDVEVKNAVVLGVSPDSAKSHQSFRNKFSLPFPLLIDQDHKIAEAYGVWREKSMYGRKYMGILRSHFVIGEDGKIIDARYNVKAPESAKLAMAAL